MNYISPPVKTGNKRNRTVEVLRVLDSGSLLVEVCEVGPRSHEISLYYVTPIEADFGTAMEWQGLAPKAGSYYQTNIGGGGNPPHCDCLGFAKQGFCRHCHHGRQLVESGVLTCRKACRHADTVQAPDGERCCCDCGASL